MKHALYEQGDPTAPDCIKDRNGDVALGMCRLCGKTEAQLDEPCTPRDGGYGVYLLAFEKVLAEMGLDAYAATSIIARLTKAGYVWQHVGEPRLTEEERASVEQARERIAQTDRNPWPPEDQGTWEYNMHLCRKELLAIIDRLGAAVGTGEGEAGDKTCRYPHCKCKITESVENCAVSDPTLNGFYRPAAAPEPREDTAHHVNEPGRSVLEHGGTGVGRTSLPPVAPAPVGWPTPYQIARCIMGGSTFDEDERLEMAANILALFPGALASSDKAPEAKVSEEWLRQWFERKGGIFAPHAANLAHRLDVDIAVLSRLAAVLDRERVAIFLYGLEPKLRPSDKSATELWATYPPSLRKNIYKNADALIAAIASGSLGG